MSEENVQLRVFGVDFTVSAHQRDLPRLREQWQWCTPDSASQRTIAPLSTYEFPAEAPEAVSLSREDDFSDDEHHPDAKDRVNPADYSLTTRITGAAIAQCAQRYLMLHAAGLTRPGTCEVVMLVAASGTGKTTATRYLAQHGFGYVSDETVITNEHREVMPYPKPLSVVRAVDDGREKEQLGPDTLHMTLPADGPLTLDSVIVLNRDSERDPDTPAELVECSLFEGLSLMLPQSSAIPETPGGLDMLARVCCEAGGIWRLDYREISDAAHLLASPAHSGPIDPFWEHVPGLSREKTRRVYEQPLPDLGDGALVTWDTVFERGEIVDALVWHEGVEALLLLGPVPVHLRGPGALAWMELEQPTTAGAILAACQEVFGDHPQADELVLDVLHQLRQSGVIRMQGKPEPNPNHAGCITHRPADAPVTR